MKYVIFKDDKTGIIEPVISGDHIAHSQMKVERAHPISAGFFSINKFGSIETYGNAESLGLSPLPDDAKWLTFVFANMGTAFFLR